MKSLQCTKEEFNCGEIHIELPSQHSQGSSVFKYTHTAVHSHHHLQSSYLAKLSLYPGNSSASSSPPPALAPTLYIFLRIQLPKYSASLQGDRGFPGGSVGKNLPVIQEDAVWSLGQEDPLKAEMATHSSILTRRIPRTEEPGGLRSMGLHRVGHDWETKRQQRQGDKTYQEPIFLWGGHTLTHLGAALCGFCFLPGIQSEPFHHFYFLPEVCVLSDQHFYLASKTAMCTGPLCFLSFQIFL